MVYLQMKEKLEEKKVITLICKETDKQHKECGTGYYKNVR